MAVKACPTGFFISIHFGWAPGGHGPARYAQCTVSQKYPNVWTSDNTRLLSDLWHQGTHHELLDEFAFVGRRAVPPRGRQQKQYGRVQPLDDRSGIEIVIETARQLPPSQQRFVVP